MSLKRQTSLSGRSDFCVERYVAMVLSFCGGDLPTPLTLGRSTTRILATAVADFPAPNGVITERTV